jgi:hypothetical protein
LPRRKKLESRLQVEISRNAKVIAYPFTDYFKGFENVDIVKRLFGDKTREVLRDLRVEFASRRGYMGVNDENGHILVSAAYLKKGDIIDLYLDIIHELVHVRQFMDGKKLFDSNYRYVERPTEIEAYGHSVEEAKNLGLSDERICEYLKTERMSDEDFKRLVSALEVTCAKPSD